MATIDLVSNLLPGILSAEGRRRQEATQAITSAAQAGGENLLGGIEGMTAVAPAASQQKRNLAGLFSGLTGIQTDVRSPIEKINAQLAASGVDMNTSAGLFQAAKLANNAGLTQQAIKLTTLGGQKRQEEQQRALQREARNQLITQAEDLGLEAIAANLKGGGDLKDAAVEINKVQIDKRTGLESRAGRRRLASTFNAPSEIMEGVNTGAYDNLKADEFMKILSGADAQTKSFTNEDGKQVTYREAADGTVFDYVNQKWVDPNELGLTPSISASKVTNVSDINAFTEAAYNGLYDNFSDLQAAANGAVDALERNATITSIVNAGMNSGTFADWETGFTAALVDVGLIEPDSEEAKTADNMRTYVSQKGKDVADTITAFGAGTGLSDQDRKFAEKMVGADPSQFTEANIRKLLALEKIYAYKAIQKYNSDVDRVVDRGLLQIAEGDSADSFKVSAPGGFKMVTYEPTPGYPANNIYQLSPGEYVTRAGDLLNQKSENPEGHMLLLLQKTPQGRNRVFNTVTQQIEEYN